MTETLVALDLETTGLDANRDAIIQIGAVKFRGERIEGEYETLVNPGVPIPGFISELTGITDAMVARAPALAAALPELLRFVGNAPVIGHNLKFDLGFLQKHGALRNNVSIDTYDLASALLPSASRYALVALAAELGVPLRDAHRALNDARATQQVYGLLAKRADELSLDTLSELVRLAADVEWGADYTFQDALRRRTEQGAAPKRRRAGAPERGLFAGGGAAAGPALQPADEPAPLDEAPLVEMFKPGGALAAQFSSYESRPQQLKMMRAVARALSGQRHLLVEAGTGTGKSLAYLVPAICWAAQSDWRVVISTNTINLQDQLMRKDLPALQQALPQEFRAAVLKGRGNYVCPRLFDAMRRRPARTLDEMRVLAKLLVWLPQSETGDRSELTLTGPGELEVWLRLSAEDEGCTTERCATLQGGSCPFYRAKRAAESAHVLVVNHALLLADAASENRVLPEYQYLIVDEAHHLEAATTDGLSFVARQSELEFRLRALTGPQSGLLAQVVARVGSQLGVGQQAGLRHQTEGVAAAQAAVLVHVANFFQQAGRFALAAGDGEVGAYSRKVRLRDEARESGEWAEVLLAWDNLKNGLQPVVQGLQRVARAVIEVQDDGAAELDDLLTALAGVVRWLTNFNDQLQGIVEQADAARICWVELGPNARSPSLHSAPLAVGPLLEKHLWFAKRAVVLTSATLATDEGFTYIKKRLHAHDADELIVGSPFNYRENTLICVAEDMPEPAQGALFQRKLEQGLAALCIATKGRALVLFTSHAQLRQTAGYLRAPLERAGIRVFDQIASSTSRHQLLQSFRAAEHAVLLGARSFWEGVDVVGESLSVLVITKLPFDVPSDPIIEARGATFEDTFGEYTVPEAALRLRQGFGRLIRSKSDRGVVVIFDRRVRSKAYGVHFLDALPACEVRDTPLALLPETAALWLADNN